MPERGAARRRARAFGATVDDSIIDARQTAVNLLGLRNHVRWPKDWTEEMLRFLAQHPLGR
ncbi:MAG TPA: hypothetical protein VMR31_14225 [Myxococcota bacterium]|nr:hypothetical protein [Myxococcota bacterium]